MQKTGMKKGSIGWQPILNPEISNQLSLSLPEFNAWCKGICSEKSVISTLALFQAEAEDLLDSNFIPSYSIPQSHLYGEYLNIVIEETCKVAFQPSQIPDLDFSLAKLIFFKKRMRSILHRYGWNPDFQGGVK